MSAEVPLDLSNESKPKAIKININSTSVNGGKSEAKSGHKSKRKVQNERQTEKSTNPVIKKAKLVTTVTPGSADANPLNRGKYGLRMLPTQVDYYQSILEDRRVRMYKETSRPIGEIENPINETRNDKPKEKSKISQPSSKFDFEIGDIVWATLPNYKTWFPALIISHLHCKQKAAKKGQTWVYWFGDHQVSEIPKSKIKSFVENFAELSKGTSSLTSIRVKEALQVLANRADISFPLDENVASSSSSDDEGTALINWAKNDFPVKDTTKKTPFKADPLNPIPASAATYLPLDSVYSEALKTDERLQQIVYSEVNQSEEADTSNELPEYKLSQIERIKSGEVSIDKICISCCCDAEALISDPSKTLLRHPIFEGGLCRLCYDNIRVTMYAPGADYKNSFCAICGQLGNLAVCENDNCHRVYCLKCIDLLVGPGVHFKVLETEEWKCYVCKPNTEETGVLRVRPNWRFNVKAMFDPLVNGLWKSANLVEEENNDKRPIRVLSLMDGIGSAKMALKQLGFQVDAYYASESDSDAIEITKSHHKDCVVFVDSIESLTLDKIISLGPIDLVLGSSPPEHSNSSGRKPLIDSKRSGHFFLYFNHILNLLRLTNKSRHIFFLCENSNPLSTHQRDVISNLFMCKPISLYANDFSQNRNRYYWSNIPGIKRPLPQAIQEKLIGIINILSQNVCRKQVSDKSSNNSAKKQIESETEDKNFEPNELEKLFDLETNYTDLSGVNKAKRQSLLTRSWCLSILAHLLWSLTDFFVVSHKES